MIAAQKRRGGPLVNPGTSRHPRRYGGAAAHIRRDARPHARLGPFSAPRCRSRQATARRRARTPSMADGATFVVFIIAIGEVLYRTLPRDIHQNGVVLVGLCLPAAVFGLELPRCRSAYLV